MPPKRPEPSDKLSRGAYKSADVPGLRIAKAARKLQYLSESESSDRRSSATASSSHYEGESSYADFSDTDSDVFQRPLKRDPRPARPTFVAKRAKHAARKVNFDVPQDSDSDDAVTVRAERSPHRLDQNLVDQYAIPRAPPIPNRMKQSGTNKAQKARRSVPNLDTQRLVKSTRVNAFRGKKVKRWRSKYTTRGNKTAGKRYARMSIGASRQRGPSQNASLALSQDRRRRWFLRVGGIASRRNRKYDRGSESESEEEDIHQLPPQRASKTVRASQSAAKSARPPTVPSYESDIEGPSDSDDSFLDDDDFLGGPTDDYMPDAFAREEHTEHTEPSKALLDRLECLTSGVIRIDRMRRLPFLRRNLRRGFQLHCRLVDVDARIRPLPRTSVSVVYTCQIVDDGSGEAAGIRDTTAKSSMVDWLCPLCDLHKKFRNQAMLDKHLAWDHPSVKALWDEHNTVLSLTIPGPPSESGPLTMRPAPISEKSAPRTPSDRRHQQRSTSTDSDLKSLVRTSSTPSGAQSESGFSASTMPTSVEREDVKPKYDVFGYSDQSRTQSRSNSTSSRSISRALSGADARGGLGPSLAPPYLPETPDERGDVYYSCRLGGPRIYDILNPLPLKDYGVLKWVVIDREEELFEIDDIRDEDKMMQALWYRWIFLNRNRFVANYFDGAKAFIEENWVLIKKGAGLLALRVLLLVLLVNNFLLPEEVATLMKYYQELANVQL